MGEGESLRFSALQKSANQFIEEQENKQTLSKTRRDVGLLSEFLKSKQENRKIEEIHQRNSMIFWVSLWLLLLFIVIVSTVARNSKRIKRVLDPSDEDSPPAACTIAVTIFVKAFLLIVPFGALAVV